MMTAKTNWTRKSQQDDVEAIIEKAVADAFERLDLDALIRDAIEKLDISRIVHETIAKTQPG